MSGHEEEINFNSQRPRRYSKLTDLFSNDNQSSNNHNENDVSELHEEGSDLENIQLQNFENPLGQRKVHIDEDTQNDLTRRKYYNHRTTSIHRNFDRKQDIALRTVPKNLEERRKWVTQAATINRQPLHEHAQKILEYMQQDSSLMTDDPDGDTLRREALRDMPQCLAVKKIIKRKFMNSVTTNKKTLSCNKMLKYQISIWFSSLKNVFRNLSYSFELWYNSLKEIEGNFGSGVSTYFRFLRKLFVLNIFIAIICMSFVIVPQIVFNIQERDNVTAAQNNASFAFEDIFTGSGYFSNSLMYYGIYTTELVNNVYSIPHSYFYTLICIFICNSVILGISMARSYRKNFIETMDGLQNVFAHKIFCGWDYGIAKTEAANLRSSTIYTELRELLSDHMKSSYKVSWMEKFLIFGLQITGHIFVFGLIAGTGYVMWILLDSHRTRTDDADANVVAIVTAIVINLLMTVFPIAFSIITNYEGYKSPRIIVFVTFLRTLVLEIVVIGILITFWLTHSQNQNCWENALGQEIYRLILFDFFFSVVFIALVDISQYYIHKKWPTFKDPEFDIAGSTFAIIYNQTLFLLGIYFAPMLSVMVIIKLFFTWYVSKWILLGFCVPPKKYWRAAQTETLFLIITFLSSLLLLFVHGYIMLNVPTSNECGPFKYVEYSHFIFVSDLEQADTSKNFLAFLNFIRKPGVLALVLIAISMVVYYLRSKSIAQRNLVDFLRKRLVLASQDKDFLLKHIMEATKGEWHDHFFDVKHDTANPLNAPPNMPHAMIINEENDNCISATINDPLLTTSSTDVPFSDVSISDHKY